jgi:RNase P protein component
MDYVVVPRLAAATLPFAELQTLLARALQILQKDRPRSGRAKPSRPVDA